MATNPTDPPAAQSGRGRLRPKPKSIGRAIRGLVVLLIVLLVALACLEAGAIVFGVAITVWVVGVVLVVTRRRKQSAAADAFDALAAAVDVADVVGIVADVGISAAGDIASSS